MIKEIKKMIKKRKKTSKEAVFLFLVSLPLLDAASPGEQQGRGQPLANPRVPGWGTKQRPAGCICPVLSDSLGVKMVNVA